jgi:hypothetical protein
MVQTRAALFGAAAHSVLVTVAATGAMGVLMHVIVGVTM